MKIYGAGIAGLLAGCTFQNARIFEAGNEGQAQHKAVLRFRSSAVGDAVGVDFRKVIVHKGIWSDGKFVQPNIQLANYYSQKVVGRLADRSIWKLEPSERFIAPEDFISILADRCSGRIEWNHELTAEEVIDEQGVAISTLPMSLMTKFVDAYLSPRAPLVAPKFNYAPIEVMRWRVRNADVFQTVYFPDPELSLYRASITGDLLIAEFTGNSNVQKDIGTQAVMQAFALHPNDVEAIETTSQRFGKIAPVDDAWRKQFIFELSSRHNIFSLGRFGTWRNILLDDVINDISVIKKLMATSTYDRNRHQAK